MKITVCLQEEDGWRGFSWSVGTDGTHALRLRPSGHLVLWFLSTLGMGTGLLKEEV